MNFIFRQALSFIVYFMNNGEVQLRVIQFLFVVHKLFLFILFMEYMSNALNYVVNS